MVHGLDMLLCDRYVWGFPKKRTRDSLKLWKKIVIRRRQRNWWGRKVVARAILLLFRKGYH